MGSGRVMSMDLREVVRTRDLLRGLLALVLCIGLVACGLLTVALYVDGPTKIVTKDRIVAAAPESNIRDEIGAMTAKEFESIKVGSDYRYIERLFGHPFGNRWNDGEERFPAVGGGEYVLEYLNKKGKPGSKVSGKHYEPSS